MTLCPGRAPRPGGESNREARRGRCDRGGRARGRCLQFERDRRAHDTSRARIDNTIDNSRGDACDDGGNDLDQHCCAHDGRLDLDEYNDFEHDDYDDLGDGAPAL